MYLAGVEQGVQVGDVPAPPRVLAVPQRDLVPGPDTSGHPARPDGGTGPEPDLGHLHPASIQASGAGADGQCKSPRAAP